MKMKHKTIKIIFEEHSQSYTYEYYENNVYICSDGPFNSKVELLANIDYNEIDTHIDYTLA